MARSRHCLTRRRIRSCRYGTRPPSLSPRLTERTSSYISLFSFAFPFVASFQNFWGHRSSLVFAASVLSFPLNKLPAHHLSPRRTTIQAALTLFPYSYLPAESLSFIGPGLIQAKQIPTPSCFPTSRITSSLLPPNLRMGEPSVSQCRLHLFTPIVIRPTTQQIIQDGTPSPTVNGSPRCEPIFYWS